MTIQKTHKYKIFSPTGLYLGMIPDNLVMSDFGYNQNISTAFVQVQVTVALSADTSVLPTTPLQDESGNNILDEAGNTILDEGALDVVGSTNANNLYACNNLIQVWEYSNYYPNGLLVFNGYISKWKANFGGSSEGQILLTCLSNGNDLNNNLVLGGQTVEQSQLTQNSNVNINSTSKGGGITGIGQTFTTGSNITSLSAILVKMASGSSSPSQYVTLNVYASPNSGTVLATATVLISGTTPTDYTFSFPAITVSPSTQYFFSVASADSNVYYENTSVSYSGGAMYRQNYGGASGDALYHQTPFSDVNNASNLYFTTYYTSSPNSEQFSLTDPAQILTTIMNSYIAAGGQVRLPVGGYTNVGVLATYTFKTQTMIQGIQAILNLSPANYFWYVDPATNILQYGVPNTVADFVLIKGRHINELNLEATRETIKNNIYFTGGDDGTGQNKSIFVQVQNELNGNRTGLALLSDNRVNSTSGGVTTARLIAQEYANDNNAETYITIVTIQDQTIDTNLFKIGKMISFANFSPFINNLLLQIVGIQKQSDQIVLQLGTLPIRTSQQLAQIQSELAYQQTVNNPATAS